MMKHYQPMKHGHLIKDAQAMKNVHSLL